MITNKRKTIGLIYEISGNPYFGSQKNKSEDRICEFSKPSEVNQLARTIKRLGYNVEIIDGSYDLFKRHKELKEKCTILFNKSIGYKGLERKITVPAICQLYGIRFLGTSAYGMTLARHKYHTNRVLAGMGFCVPNAILIQIGDNVRQEDLKDLRCPVIVKPNQESDALGITENSICQEYSQICLQTKKMQERFKQPVIIEEYINGEEWKVAVLGNYPNTCALGCVGVMKKGIPMNNSLQARVDVVEDTLTYYKPTNKNTIRESLDLSIRIHDLMGLKDYSRCDFRLDDQDKLYCMEISTHPDIIDDSSFIAAAKQTYFDYDAAINEIIKTAIARNKVDSGL